MTPRAALVAAATGLLFVCCSETKHQTDVADAAPKATPPAAAESNPAKPPPQPEARSIPRTSNAPGTELIACTGEIVGYDDRYMYCNHDEVAADEPSDILILPLAVVKLHTPMEHKDRIVRILFENHKFENVRSSTKFWKGSIAAFDLPKDFLEGKYSQIFDGNVDNLRLIADEPSQATKEPGP